MLDLKSLSHKLSFSKVRVLCLGDVMLDKFVYGAAQRLSPEAPIPVFKVDREQIMPGGAGNVVRNAGTLGATGTLISVVGEDDASRTLLDKIDEQRGVRARLIRHPERKTTVKTRFVIDGQQLLRADVENTMPVVGELAERVLEAFETELEHTDIVVLSDYAKGVLSEEVLRPAIEMARAKGKRIIVDPKSTDFTRYRGATVILPNTAEICAAMRMPCNDDTEAAAAATAAQECGIDNVLLTRSAKGMTLAQVKGAPVHLPARAQEIHDVSGAGDTVVATVAVALASGLNLVDSAQVANLAGGVVVGKIGTAAVYQEDLADAVQRADMLTLRAEIATREQAVDHVARWRSKGLTVGFTNGCFDLIHPGHISLLTQAKEACDRLIVGLNTDASTQRLKGPTRPVQNEIARSVVLASLAAVDLVVSFDEDTPMRLIEAIRPDVLVKGADYAKDEVVGADLVTGYGGEVLLAQLKKGFSTTLTIAGVVDADAPAKSPAAADDSPKKSKSPSRPRKKKRAAQGARTTL